jgi:hypothetical protein
MGTNKSKKSAAAAAAKTETPVVEDKAPESPAPETPETPVVEDAPAPVVMDLAAALDAEATMRAKLAELDAMRAAIVANKALIDAAKASAIDALVASVQTAVLGLALSHHEPIRFVVSLDRPVDGEGNRAESGEANVVTVTRSETKAKAKRTTASTGGTKGGKKATLVHSAATAYHEGDVLVGKGKYGEWSATVRDGEFLVEKGDERFFEDEKIVTLSTAGGRVKSLIAGEKKSCNGKEFWKELN